MRRFLLILIFLSLAGCFTSGKRGTEKGLAIYDLGAPSAPLVESRSTPLAIEVRAPLWMDSLGINYRLPYADPSRLHEYALARWAGPPAQLVQLRLAQQLSLATSGQGRSRCVLRVEISEFSQRFVSAERSLGVLQGRAYWLDPSRRQVAELTLNIEKPAENPNSASGVVALQAAVGQLAVDLQAWEKQLSASGKTGACSA